MKAEQLELELWGQLQRAQQNPEFVDVESMLDAVEATVVHLPESEQLRFAGEALLQMAELCAARSDLWMTAWKETARDPVVGQRFFAEVVRQTMVDLSELMEARPARKQRVKSSQKPEGSIVALVDKASSAGDGGAARGGSSGWSREKPGSVGDRSPEWTEAIERRLQDTP